MAAEEGEVVVDNSEVASWVGFQLSQLMLHRSRILDSSPRWGGSDRDLNETGPPTILSDPWLVRDFGAITMCPVLRFTFLVLLPCISEHVLASYYCWWCCRTLICYALLVSSILSFLNSHISMTKLVSMWSFFGVVIYTFFPWNGGSLIYYIGTPSSKFLALFVKTSSPTFFK